MKLRIALIAAVAFAAIVLARMPAAWLVPTRGAWGSCTSVEGSLWSGLCAALRVQGTPIGDVSWQLHPARLLAARLAAHVAVARGEGTLNADVELGVGGHVTLRQVLADLPLDPAVIPGLGPELRGRAHVELTLAQIEHGVITRLEGRIEARDLVERTGSSTPLGSYELTFPGGGEPLTGKLRDLSGPLALEGTLRLTRAPGYVLQALIAPRSGAPAEIVNTLAQWSALGFLGPPDATGRRSFSLEGTF